MRDRPSMSENELVERYESYIRKWHGAKAGRIRAAVSCSAPQRVTPSYLQALSTLSRTWDIPFNMHILETRLQRVLGEEKFGGSLIKYVADAGVLDKRCMVIHSIWVDEQDIAIMADSGCSIAHNPVSNLKIGSGIMPYRALKDAGINICLGTDESTVDDGVNLWTVGKMAGLIHNVGDPEYQRWPTASEILRDLTSGGAKAMLQGNAIGKLEPGYQADIILVDLDTLPFTPLNDLRRQLVYCENGSSVRTTIVAGEVVMDDGKLLTIDERELRNEIRGMSDEIKRYMSDCAKVATEVAPYYRRMYQMCVERDVGMRRWMDFDLPGTGWAD
jgi:cytosine/adenosine deaminase-related metal-dependent hydrolase